MRQLLSRPVFTSPAKNHQAYLLHCRSAIQQAGILQVLLFWIFIAIVTLTGAGVRGQAYPLGYGVGFLVTGFLPGARSAAIMTVLPILSGAVMVYSARAGLYPIKHPEAPTGYRMVSIALFPVILFLHNLSHRGMRLMSPLVQASELRCRMLVKRAPVGIVTVGKERKIKQVNPTACENLEIAFKAISHPVDVIRDNGIRFGRKHADRIFQVFQSLRGPGEFSGIGVGLTIVPDIIHRHGGRIWMESQPSQSAAFFFTLPEE